VTNRCFLVISVCFCLGASKSGKTCCIPAAEDTKKFPARGTPRDHRPTLRIFENFWRARRLLAALLLDLAKFRILFRFRFLRSLRRFTVWLDAGSNTLKSNCISLQWPGRRLFCGTWTILQSIAGCVLQVVSSVSIQQTSKQLLLSQNGGDRASITREWTLNEVVRGTFNCTYQVLL
jgi:hypothetical protein